MRAIATAGPTVPLLFAYGCGKARTGQVVAQTGPEQEILSLPGTPFVANPRPLATRERGTSSRYRSNYPHLVRNPNGRLKKKRETSWQQLPRISEDGPNTRRAAVRACKYLRAMVNQCESTIQAVHVAANYSCYVLGLPLTYLCA